MATSGRSAPSADRQTIDALRGVLRQIEAMAQGYQMATIALDRIGELARRALAATEEGETK